MTTCLVSSHLTEVTTDGHLNSGWLLKLSVCPVMCVRGGSSGLLLDKVFPLVVSGRALRVRLAVEGKLMNVFGLSCFHFLVPVRLFPAADDPGSYGQHNHGDEYGHCDHA